MKIFILKENLKKITSIVNRATSLSGSLPILKNILFKKENDYLNLSATDLEIAISSWFPVKVKESFSPILIPGNVLVEVLNLIPEEKIEIEFKKEGLILKSKTFKTKINSQDVSDFPILPEVKKENLIKIDSQVFKNALSSVIGATSTVSARPELSGVLFFLDKDYLRVVATDSFRLAQKTIDKNFYQTKIKEEVKLLIPQKTIQELIKIIDLFDDLSFLDIYFDPNQVAFDFQNTILISRLINASFPEYQEIIPKSFDTQIVVSKEKLISGIKLSSIFSSKINDLKFKIPSNLKNLELISQDPSSGENTTYIEGKIEGSAQEIVFNYKYLLEGLKPIKSENVFLGLNKNSRRSLIQDVEDDSYIYILMPIKI